MKDLDKFFFERYSISEKTKKIFNAFLAYSDEPGEFLSNSEKDELIKKSKTDPEALKKFEENKNSKYRVNSLSAPLMIAEIFLDSSEAKDVPFEEKNELLKKISKVIDDIKKAKPTGMTDNEVGQVIEIVEKIKKYLK
ncbi:hypothetical protein KJ671_00065 [Patescibacteria group bacterium]|nr:hypothetical protein [Patescibacteria group bacterium]